MLQIWCNWLTRIREKSVHKPLVYKEILVSQLAKFKSAESLHDVALLFGYTAVTLGAIIYSPRRTQPYTVFEISKKNGGKRTIKAPDEKLKVLQKRLAKALYACWEEVKQAKIGEDLQPRTSSHGFEKDKSIITNAQPHTKKRYVLNLDLEGFFPSINFGRVRGFFIKNKHFKLHPKAATILAQIVCHENSLPQGSPCSPIIANMIASTLDSRLVKLAKKYELQYTRYADDITFSTNQNKFPAAIARKKFFTLDEWETGKVLKKTITDSGFKINLKKTRMQLRHSRQEVTGLVVNKKVNINAVYYSRVRAMCHTLFKHGFYYHVLETEKKSSSVKTILDKAHRKIARIFGIRTERKSNNRECKIIAAKVGTLSQLEGMLSHIHHVRKTYETRGQTTNKLNDTSPIGINTPEKQKKLNLFKGAKRLYYDFLFFKFFHALEKPLIICEGVTDFVYLKCALKSLHASYGNLIEAAGSKASYKISFFNYTGRIAELFGMNGGSGDVKNLIVYYSETIKKFYCPGQKYPVIILLDNDAGSKDVYAAMKEKLKTPIDGMKSFYHICENLYVIPTPKAAPHDQSKIEDFFDPALLSTLIDGKSFSADNKYNKQTHYGKADFAKKVVRANYGDINFSAFRQILDTINNVIAHHTSSISD